MRAINVLSIIGIIFSIITFVCFLLFILFLNKQEKNEQQRTELCNNSIKIKIINPSALNRIIKGNVKSIKLDSKLSESQKELNDGYQSLIEQYNLKRFLTKKKKYKKSVSLGIFKGQMTVLNKKQTTKKETS